MHAYEKCYCYVIYNPFYINIRAIADKYNFKSTCKDCASPEQHFIVSPSPLLLLVLLLLIRSGDVIPNPGPGEPNRRYSTRSPCVHCDIGVPARSKAISCDSCDKWTHVRCSNTMTTGFYYDLCHSGAVFNFLCNKCSARTLTFYRY